MSFIKLEALLNETRKLERIMSGQYILVFITQLDDFVMYFCAMGIIYDC
jgi:hypothetical protein